MTGRKPVRAVRGGAVGSVALSGLARGDRGAIGLVIGNGLMVFFGALSALAFGVAGAEIANSTRKGPSIMGGVAIGSAVEVGFGGSHSSLQARFTPPASTPAPRVSTAG